MPQLNYPYLASQLFNTPLLCTPALLEAVQQALMPRLTGQVPADAVQALDPRYKELDAELLDMRTSGGVAVIPVHGILTTRRGQVNAQCMEISSYEKLNAWLEAALENDAVEHIVLDMNTPGGAAVGCFDFAERIYQARSIKPITAVINFSAYSAGYMMAAAASEIIIPQTGGVGSIGVIAAHVDLSKAIDAAGLKVTTFYRGDHKNDMSPYEPITDQAAAELNKSLDELYGLFVEKVAEYRGLSTQAVKDTQAGLYRGVEAVKIGLADKVQYPQDAVNQLATQLAEQRAATKSSKASRVRLQAAAMQMQL
ncbi:S49 family peptidase [Candidatus Dojkabacteria bacterium]|uniref:S49 family peptidase n=1 Tax=Candidatus Dojkabacteria bacterium TaxID=2099670 RepID=A0A5C7J9W4_9BACT|nr:MAG: S49 family peptidase [Candidatus Dojkabacteria bacterium]